MCFRSGVVCQKETLGSVDHERKCIKCKKKKKKEENKIPLIGI